METVIAFVIGIGCGYFIGFVRGTIHTPKR